MSIKHKQCVTFLGHTIKYFPKTESCKQFSEDYKGEVDNATVPQF